MLQHRQPTPLDFLDKWLLRANGSKGQAPSARLSSLILVPLLVASVLSFGITGKKLKLVFWRPQAFNPICWWVHCYQYRNTRGWSKEVLRRPFTLTPAFLWHYSLKLSDRKGNKNHMKSTKMMNVVNATQGQLPWVQPCVFPLRYYFLEQDLSISWTAWSLKKLSSCIEERYSRNTSYMSEWKG